MFKANEFSQEIIEISDDDEEYDFSSQSINESYIARLNEVRFSFISNQKIAAEIDNNTPDIESVFRLVPDCTFDEFNNRWIFNSAYYKLVQLDLKALDYVEITDHIYEQVFDEIQTPNLIADEELLKQIEPTLVNSLKEYQKEGVLFGISKQGRVLIADEVGLGKSHQAIALADFYKRDWPLLIVTTASMRQIWFNRITELLPRIEPVHIFCIDSVEKELDNSAKIVITSYGYLKPLFKMFKKFEFGSVIIDQSHYIKDFRAERTRALTALCKNVKRAILIDGSPALNNPRELYTQLRIIDPNFMYFSTYAFRYCAGELVGGCLFANGATNCEELNVLLHKKFMTRHTKAEYDGYLTNKLREQIILDVRLNQRDRINLEMHHLKYAREPGDLFKYYALTAEFKIEQVCSYVEDFLQISADKFIVFAYHQVMLNALSDLLSNLDVEFIRVDSGCNLKDDLVYRFQRDTECRAAILSLNTCATGFNLTAAKTVIFAELAYSPEIMQQAEGRVHRVGQEGDVEVKYLCAEGTLDNHLWYGILKKQEILNTIGIDDDDIELNFIASRHVYQEPRTDENMIINEDDSDDDVVQPVQLLRKRRNLSSDDEEDTNEFHKIII